MDEIKNTYKSIDVNKSKSDPDNKDNCDATCAKCESDAVLNAGASTLKNTPSEHGQGLKVNQGITDVEKQSDAILIKDDSKKNLTKPGQDNKISSHTTNVENQLKSTLSVHDSKTLESKPNQNDTTIGSDIRCNVKKQSYIVLSLNDAKKSVSKSAKDDKEESDTRNVKKQSDLIPNIESEPKKGDKDSDETNMKNQSDVVLNTDDDCNTCEKCQPHAVLNAGNSIVKSAESEPAQGHKVDQDATDVKRQSDIILNANKSSTIKSKPDQDDKLDTAIIKNLEKSEVKRETVEKDREKIEVKSKDNDDAKSEEKDREKVEVKREEKDGYKTETKSEKKYEDKDDVKSEEKSKEKVASKTPPNKNLDTPDVKKVILDDIYKDEKISTDLKKKKSKKRKGFKCLKIFSKTFKTLKKTDEQEYEGKKNEEIDKEKYLKETKNIVGIEDNEWFIQQYEKCIGNRKIKPIDPDILMKDLKMKAMKRFIPESMYYRPKQSGKPEDSLFLSWKGPVVPKCVCPYRECFCRGDTNFLKEKSTSYCSKVVKRGFKRCNLGALGLYFQSNKADAKALYNKVQERLALEQEYYKKVEKKHKLHKLNPEFCFEKCYHCYHPNERNLRTTQFLPLFMYEYEKQVEEGDEDGNLDETETEDEGEEDDRICNDYDNSCGVSTQTDPIGDDGNFILPEWLKNKVLLPSIQNSIFSNLEGSKIEINPYKELKEEELDDRMDLYAQKMEGFSLKDIKSRLSKLLSSILEIKDSGVPINTRYTQLPCRGVVCDDSDTCFTGYSFRHNGSRDYICGAVDYDFLPEIPYTEHLSVSDIRKAYEQRDNDPCPCCSMYDRNRSRLAYEECLAKKGRIITPRKNVCEKLPDLTQKASKTDSNEKQNVQDERNKSQDPDGGIKNKENGSKPSTSKNEAKDGSYEIMNKVHFNIPNTISETEPQKDLDVNNSISSIIKVKPSPTPKSSPKTLEERCDFLNTTNVINQLSGSKNSVKLSVNNMQLKSGSDIKKVPLNIIADDKTSQSTFTISSDALNPTIVAKTMGSGDTLDTISPSITHNAKGESNSNTPSVLSSIFNWIFNPKASLFNRPKSSTVKLRDNTPSKDLKISSRDRKTSSKDLKIVSKENTVEGEKVAKKASDVSEKEVFSLQYSTTQSLSSTSSTRKVQSDMS